MDLSTAYDCLPDNLIVAKFKANDLDNTGLNLFLNKIAFCRNRIKGNSSYRLLLTLSEVFLKVIYWDLSF